MKLSRLREFILSLKRNFRPGDVRSYELRDLDLSLILWLYMAFLVCGQFIPSLSDASTTKWLMIVAFLLMSYDLRLIRKELRDLRKAVTKDVP